jgi:hypothetical protein
MNELDYMKQSLAELYDKLETLLGRYERSHSHDDLYRELSGIVYVVDGPNDAASNGGNGYYCKRGQCTANGRAIRPSRPAGARAAAAGQIRQPQATGGEPGHASRLASLGLRVGRSPDAAKAKVALGLNCLFTV